MKKACFIFLFIISSMGFAQNNYIVKTDDGRRVLLKADYTWEYIDLVAPKVDSVKSEAPKKEIAKVNKSGNCNLPDDFKEPALNNKIQNQLKRGRATITHVKMKVAKDKDCDVEDVILIRASEKKSDGFYDFCVKGEEVSYKRVGYNIIKRKKLL